MTLILDAGALVALERGHDKVVALMKHARTATGRPPKTHGGVVGQVWRGGSGRQALLARWLDGVDVVGLDDELGKRAGVLLGHSGGKDVIDAAVVALAVDDDIILTSDPSDLTVLAAVAKTHVEIVSV